MKTILHRSLLLSALSLLAGTIMLQASFSKSRVYFGRLKYAPVTRPVKEHLADFVSSNMLHANSSTTTVNWTGAVSADWSNAGNWSTNSVPDSADSVKIGFVSYTRQPVISSNVRVAYVLFGGSIPDTLTINAGDTLRVGGSIVQGHNFDSAIPKTLLRGNGSIYCDSLIVGNNVLPRIVVTKTAIMTSTIAALNISGNLVVRSCTIDLLSGGVANNNSLFSLEGGQLTLAGRIVLDNLVPPYVASLPQSKPLAKFQININSSQNATLVLSDSSSVVSTHSGCDTIDFYNHVAGTGKSVVQYAGGNQILYTNNTDGIDTLPYTYQNLLVTAAGNKTAGTLETGNSLNVGGDLSVTSGTLDLQTYAAACTVYGNYTNRAVTRVGSPGITFKGPNFFNSNQFNYDNALVTFSGGTQNLTDSTSAGTNLRMVVFADTGIKHIHRGTFAIIDSGRVSLSNNVTVTVDTTATFILRSDSLSTAAITAIPSGSVITGIVNAEWFVQGSWTNTSLRTYRLMSSAVNHTSKTDGTGDYNLNWLKGTTLYDGAILTGTSGSANGFDLNGGPTIYLYREDVNYNNGAFTSGNYRGMNKINNTDLNDIGTQKRFTTSALADTTVRLPIGNGAFFFFRGNRVNPNGTTSGTKTTQPYNYPESVTFTNKGTVNQGQVQVRIYFRNDNYLSYTDSAYVSNSQVRGFNMVGNPYPSAINWDNFSATDSTASIYGPGLSDTISFYNPVTKVFDTYVANPAHNRDSIYNGSGSATNIIASGKGFFVRVDPTSPNKLTASLRFREQAKFNPPTVSGSRSMARKTGALKTGTRANAVAKVQKVVATPKHRSIELRLLQEKIPLGEALISFSGSAKVIRNPVVPLMDLDGGAVPQTLLATFSATRTPVVSNRMALPAKVTSIPLYIGALQTGTYALSLYSAAYIPMRYAISLYDQLTKTTLDLRKHNRYNFKIDNTYKQKGNNRFTLTITPHDK
ncbi:MAG TPA: hypothetical protein VHB54_04480 [Mucilaginibacter sp.]|nr:hypothetical protein [Mucilaginibacter sp.]